MKSNSSSNNNNNNNNNIALECLLPLPATCVSATVRDVCVACSRCICIHAYTHIYTYTYVIYNIL